MMVLTQNISRYLLHFLQFTVLASPSTLANIRLLLQSMIEGGQVIHIKSLSIGIIAQNVFI